MRDWDVALILWGQFLISFRKNLWFFIYCCYQNKIISEANEMVALTL
jgi:hypothetical protein